MTARVRRSRPASWGELVESLTSHTRTHHAAEPVPQRGLTITRVIVVVTALTAATSLAWSLHIKPGDALFYPATFLVAAVYGVGCLAAGRVGGTSLPWRCGRDGIVIGAVAGLGLAVVFFIGAFLVRYVPILRDPVSDLLDHARVGSLALVALTTVVNGVAEEAFHRGAAWRVITPPKRIIVTTALYTAVTAAAGIPLLALAAAALGLLAAALRQHYASLTPAVVAHLTWSLLMLFVLPHIVP